VLADVGRRDEREPVARRAEDDVERAVRAQRVDQRRRVGAERGGGEAVLEQRQPAAQGADLEGDRAGIDPGDARTALRRAAQASCSLAIS
jgi:hypothetical protein